MELEADRSARWTLELRKHWIRGKNVLLYGSVSDRFLVNGVYRGVTDFLPEFLRGIGYEVVVEYDLVDGFRCPTPEMLRLFQNISAPALRRTGRPSAGSEAVAAEPDGRGA